MSKTKCLIHAVINTKYRQMTLEPHHVDELYSFIQSIVKRNNCVLYKIGGIENHIHILFDLHPEVSLSHLMWDIKRSSSIWIKRSRQFPYFIGWGKEYGAFSVSERHYEVVATYINNQRTHHQHMSFEDEFKRFMIHNGEKWDEKLLT